MPALHTLAVGASVSVAFGVVDTGNLTRLDVRRSSGPGVVVSLGSSYAPRTSVLPITVCTKSGQYDDETRLAGCHRD